jgi:hypothetical protein
MEDIYLAESIGENRLLCVSPLSKKTYREARTRGLGGDQGYFIYETDEAKPSSGIEVIAKAASLEAALRLFDMLRGGLMSGSAPT